MAAVPERILLVEGPNDKHVIRHIRDCHGDLADFEIRDTGGIDNLLDAIEAETKAAGRQSVGLLVDANSSLDDRWRSLADRLRKVGIEPPETVDEEGCIIRFLSLPTRQTAGSGSAASCAVGGAGPRDRRRFAESCLGSRACPRRC